jgi:hypothetical protein
MTMRLTFKAFDGRRENHVFIIDQDTGEKVGLIQSAGVGFAGFGGISISLFGGKYTAQLHRYEECWGFVKGVEAVLNHMISITCRDARATAA